MDFEFVLVQLTGDLPFGKVYLSWSFAACLLVLALCPAVVYVVCLDAVDEQDMWEDFSHWCPYMFRDERFCARFHYDETDSVSSFKICSVWDALDPILANPAWVVDTTGAHFQGL